MSKLSEQGFLEVHTHFLTTFIGEVASGSGGLAVAGVDVDGPAAGIVTH